MGVKRGHGRKNADQILEIAKEADRKNTKKMDEYPPPPEAFKPKKHAGGRPRTVEYDRPKKLHVAMSEEAFRLLEKAVALEAARRFPERIDKGLVVEEALREYCKKRKF